MLESNQRLAVIDRRLDLRANPARSNFASLSCSGQAMHDDRANDMDFHLLKIYVLPFEAQQLPNPKAREHSEEHHCARWLLQDAKQCRDLLDGKHNGHPGPLGTLTPHAYGIHIKPFPPDRVIENRAHDVSSFGFASVRILERTKPLLHRDCFDLGYVIASPPGQNPLPEMAYVGDLRLPRFGAVRPQLFFPVVFDKRLNTDRSQAGARILSVDVCPKCGDGLLSRRLIRILFERSNHQIASRPAAIRLDFAVASSTGT